MHRDTRLRRTPGIAPAGEPVAPLASHRRPAFPLRPAAPAAPAAPPDDELLFLCPDRDGAVGFVPSRR